MKKILLCGILLISTLSFIGCGNSVNGGDSTTGTQTEENSKKEITDTATWVDSKNNSIAEVKVNSIRKFTEKDDLYKNIKEDYKDNDLYLIEYTYKNINFGEPLEITLNDFMAYNKNGENMDLKPQGTNSFKGEVGNGKSAKTTMIMVAPKGYNEDEVIFEVGRYDLEKIEIKQKINK